MDASAVSNTGLLSGSNSNFTKTYSRPLYGVDAGQETDLAKPAQQSAEMDRPQKSGMALEIFRRELRYALWASFRTRFTPGRQDYLQTDDGATPKEVANETLGAAQRFAAEAPVDASRAMITFRQKVEESASFVRSTVGDDDGLANMDTAARDIDGGLEKLTSETAGNRESSASVLDVQTRSRQSSTIRIRTQEGDIVNLDLRRMDNLSATDVAVADGENTASATEVWTFSRSNMELRIEGDLNEAESAAIREVFAQAEDMANRFFNGDLFAAFDLAAGFEYDSDQLARVNLDFRSRQVSSVTYAAVVANPAPVSVSEPVAPAPESKPAPVISVVRPPSDEPPPVVPFDPPTPVKLDVPVDEPADIPQPEQPLPDVSVFARFFDLLSDFLRSVGGGFETGSARFHYSQSFKLEILKSVLEVSAPDSSDNAVEGAVALINDVAEADDDD